MGIWNWSRTAASNGTADPAINLREGMAPSQVNNSARATLAALASYRDDMSGAKETGGANSAYTLATYAGVVDGSTDYLNGVCVAFTAHATNAANPTLNVDSGGALPLRGVSGVALSPGVLVEGTPYQALLSPAKDEWIILGYRIEPTTVPLGVPLLSTYATVPNSQFILPYGQAISRTTYAAYFALVGTTFGTGDGSTTFNVVDMRGRLPVGQDNLGGVAANRVTSAGSGIDGVTIGATGGAQNVTIARANLPNDSVSVAIVDPGHAHGGVADNGGAVAASGTSRNVAADGSTDAAFTGISASFNLNGGVTQTAVNKMPPAIVLPYIMRVL